MGLEPFPVVVPGDPFEEFYSFFQHGFLGFWYYKYNETRRAKRGKCEQNAKNPSRGKIFYNFEAIVCFTVELNDTYSLYG